VSEGIVEYNFIGEFVLALMLEINKGVRCWVITFGAGIEVTVIGTCCM